MFQKFLAYVVAVIAICYHSTEHRKQIEMKVVCTHRLNFQKGYIIIIIIICGFIRRTISASRLNLKLNDTKTKQIFDASSLAGTECSEYVICSLRLANVVFGQAT